MCMTPFILKATKEREAISVPCGKCPLCIARRVSSWSFRLMQEMKTSSNAHFLTLTYGITNARFTRKGFMTIEKKELQLFFKRLRKAHEKEAKEKGTVPPKIKYYAVGEYGGRTLRPHYHAIVFNASVHLIQSAWNLGHVHYGSVSGASIGYTLKYMSKKGKIPLHANDDRVPEFALMSKSLGCHI